MATYLQSLQPSPLAVFRKRSFTLLWLAQLVSTMGSALTSLAASILIFRLTGSALSVGFMLMATALPSLLVGLIAGVFVDQWNRKRIMLATDLLRALLAALIPFLLPFGIGWLYLIVVLSSTLGQFWEPAHATLLPEIATDEELAAANALICISAFGSTAVGFAAAGLLTSQYSIAWAFYVDALTFLLSAASIARLNVAPLATSGTPSMAMVLGNLRVGIRGLWATPLLRSLLLSCVPAFFGIGLLNTVLLPFALRALHATEFEYGLIEAFSSVGFVAGALLMARFADRFHPGQWIALSYLALGILCAGLSLATSVPLVIGLYSVAGFVNAPNYVGRSLVIQRGTVREMRGRVNSAFLVTRNVVFLMGMAAAGLADLFGVRQVYLAGALTMIGAGTLVLVLPGLGQPAAEWRRAMVMLRGARGAPGLGRGIGATRADVDLLALRVPALATLSVHDRRSLAQTARVHDVAAGTAIVHQGDTSDAAYFILDGRTVAGRDDEHGYRVLEVLNAGDFFGEIAALAGVPRTATVVADRSTRLLRVPAATLRHLMRDPRLNRILLSKLTERMVRMNMIDLPRFAGLDQRALQELRTQHPPA
ncbi:MAG: hypothetical protein AVDCRST_MAG26-1194 [uncultured Chloroflexia bacterium]|uniref:Cyclic nucleotide-binding domain-containing protein n=1 Tax=uncultured Chloroflexia bacterium TaxID=1672391 RepID=A0A6J4HWE9_9CHLR|nr:MAG: hypothetical protein AVDCRST_MAG26-1194 [uncultured Chloroflexia bacterium]